MSFMMQAEEALETGSTEEQWVYNRSEKLLVEINLGSGVFLEAVYYTIDDTSLDNIDLITLVEEGERKLLSDDDIEILHKLDIL